mmetsp:Transcript_27948/g.67937  ORF Transcript_27948/g.67937 Transcript_27948/m.67937 type:complete len:300 (-) Transcript_27948:216-1115(-)
MGALAFSYRKAKTPASAVNPDEKRTSSRLLIIHFKAATHRLKVFPGTPLADLEALIRRLLDLEEGGAPLLYTDADGDPVALSGHIPDGYAVHVAVREKRKFPKLPAQVEWRQWARLSSQVKTNAREWVADGDDYNTRAMSHELYGPGKHYAVVNMSRTMCCVSIGFVPADIDPARVGGHTLASDHMIYAMSMSLGSEYFKLNTTAGTRCTTPVRIGILADMDNKEVMMFPLHPGKKGQRDEVKGKHCIARIGGLPQRIRFAVGHPKHGVTVIFEEPNTTLQPHFDKMPPLLKKNKDGQW